MKSLNIIGAGTVGKILGKALIEEANLNLQSVLNKTEASSVEATAFLKSGNVAKNFNELKKADIWMISVPDDQISIIANELLITDILEEGNVIFHCSGAFTSNEFISLKSKNVNLASIHPVKSFVKDNFNKTLKGTHCSIEGNKKAISKLKELLEKVGLNTFEIKTQEKMLFHAGCVFTSNYLTAVFELGLSCFKASGVDEKNAKKIIAPLVRETLENNLRLSSEDALSGPIKRGDYNLIKEQLEELQKLNPDIYKSYKTLGKTTLGILEKEKQNIEYQKIKDLFN